MEFAGLFGQETVSDAAAAERFYTAVFGREPDARPMAGLLEWHGPTGSGGHPTFGVQVYEDRDRAGRSSVVVFDADLDATAARLREAGIDADGPTPGGGGRVLTVLDPDGNRLVFVG